MTKQHGWGPSAGPVPALQWGQCKNVRTVFLTCHPPATTDWSGTHSGVQASPKLIIFLPPSLKCWDYRCELSCWFGPILFAAPKNISFPSSHGISEWYSGRHTAQESILLCKTAQVRKESHSSFDLGCLHLKKTIFFFISFSNRDNDIGKMFFSPLYDSWHKTGIFLFSLGKPVPMSCQWEQNHCLGCYQAELYPVASKS